MAQQGDYAYFWALPWQCFIWGALFKLVIHVGIWKAQSLAIMLVCIIPVYAKAHEDGSNSSQTYKMVLYNLPFGALGFNEQDDPRTLLDGKLYQCISRDTKGAQPLEFFEWHVSRHD